MTIWYKAVMEKLQASGLFSETNLVGAKIRAAIDDTRFLDIHFDPISRGYSYAVIDYGLPYAGDKRLFGWDDYPHESSPEIQRLDSYPHHFQKRGEDGKWIFDTSPMRGDIENEIDHVIAAVKFYLLP